MSVAKRRHMQIKGAEPVKQVSPEPAVLYEPVKVFVARGYHHDIKW